MRIFRHHIPIPFIVLALGDFFICFGAIFLAAIIRFDNEMFHVHLDSGWIESKAWIFSAVMILNLLAVGLYQSRFRENLTGIAIRVGLAVLLGATTLILIFYFIPVAFVGRGVFALALGLVLVGLTINRVVFYSAKGQDFLKKRVLVLGSGEKAQSILAQMRRKSDLRGFNLVGFVAVAGEQTRIDKSRLVRLENGLVDFVKEHDIHEIVVAVDDRRQDFPLHELLDCKMDRTEVADILTFFERECGKIRLDLLHPSWLIFSDGFKLNSARELSKKIFDITASVLVVLLTWSVMLTVAVAIMLEDRGREPVFYSQLRVGKNGKIFKVLKFRSMAADAETDGKPQWAQANDDRITKVGAIIRKYRLDELPQIFNVLKGEMSFVGPRPERPEFVKELSDGIRYYEERHRVKPGISGWAQLCYPYGASVNDAVQKLQYDLYYVKNQSLLLDLSILVQTAEVVFFGKGAR